MVGLPIPANEDAIMADMPSFTIADISGSPRYIRQAGGWKVIGKKCIVKMLLKLNYDYTAPTSFPIALDGGKLQDTGVRGMPLPKGGYSWGLNLRGFKQYGTTLQYYSTIAWGIASVDNSVVENNAVGTCLKIGLLSNASASDNLYVMISGEYEIE